MKLSLLCAAGLLGSFLIGAGAAADPVPPRYSVQVLSPIGPQTYPLAFNNKLQFTTYYSFDHEVPYWMQYHFVDFNEKAEKLSWNYACCDSENMVRQYTLSTGSSQVLLTGLREANAINDHSVIAGAYTNAGGNQRAVLYDGDNYEDLGTLGGANSSATDVNNNGEAIGWSETADGGSHPFLYRDGTMHDLSTVPGWVGSPNAINDHGQMVISYRDEAFNNHVFFYSDGELQEIVAPGPMFFFADLNNAGQVLLYRPEAPKGSQSLLWQDGQTYDLLSLVDPSAHYFYSPAVDMNDNGQILIRGCRQSYFDDCFALALQPVPEPSTWAMLLAGLGIFVARARARAGAA